MEVLLVRHAESAGNAQARLQGSADSPLTGRGKAQARALGDWLGERDLRWQAAYASPLARARETAAILVESTGFPSATPDPDLTEVRVGSLEGLTREEIVERHPDYIHRDITGLGDFSEFGGEGYDELQARIERVLAGLVGRHREAEDRVLVVAHGGVNFQLIKRAVCLPVPRVCILALGNCTITALRFRDRRGTYMAEVAWHVPLELIGLGTGAGTTGVFR